MNGPLDPGLIALADVQAEPDARALAIDSVGVSGVRYPVALFAHGRVVPTVATWAMGVSLAPEARGTHMSRFIEVLEANPAPLDQAGFRGLARRVRERLGAASASIEMRFPWFVRKVAPASGVASWLDCEVAWRAEAQVGGDVTFDMEVATPVTSLCPCSKEIADRGAHNQRSRLRIEARLASAVQIEELVAVAEHAASCEVYGLLKRADEKVVTERAYDNPRFAEDLVRDVALALGRDARVLAFSVEAENFESIHNHSAFARIGRPLRAP